MKKYLLPLLLLTLGTSAVFSQNVGIGTTTPLARLHVSDGSVVFTAVHPLPVEAGPTPVMGAGSRLLWYADKAAFRAGAVGPSDVFEDGSAYWDAPNVGQYSFAAGYNVKASHNGSVAIGHNLKAENDYAIALGDGSLASGAHSFAEGYFSRATGDKSIAIGYGNSARGNFASIAMGWGNFAMMDAAISIGYKTRATGVKAISIGDSTVARAYGSISLGRFNDSAISSSPTAWVPYDPLLVIGNGTSEATRHNALAVYKNGSLLARNPTPVEVIILANKPYPPDSGSGTRMMWVPQLSAFRVGTLGDIGSTPENEAKYWNRDSIGGWSFAAGTNTLAIGNTSTAFGYNTRALGNYASAMGAQTIAAPYASTAIGSRNDTLSYSSKTSWVLTDPLLYIGNTAPAVAGRSNAVVVYKNANVDLNGFTRLGKSTEAAPKIKMKKLTAVSSNVQNDWVNVPHGLTKSKILAVDILMNVPGFVNVPPGYTYHSGYEYQYQVSDAYIVVVNTNGNSANILLKNFTVLITYEE